MRVDPARAKADPRYLLAAVDVPLTAWQAAALALEKRTTAIVAGRQMGKSLVLAGLAIWWAWTRRRAQVLIVSSTEDGARRLLATIRRIAASSPLLSGSVTDELTGLLKLSNGSEIRCVSASERQIRGHSVDLLLIDEAQLVPDDLIVSAAMPTTAARPKARIVLAGSAGPASGTFYDHCKRGERGDEHVQTFKWVARAVDGEEDAPWISPSAVESARSAMSPSRFAAEYLADFALTGDLWISRAQLERALVDRPLYSLAALDGPARISLGIDWGRRVDRSVAVGIARIPGTSVFTVICAHRAPADTPGTDFIRQVCQSPAHYGYVTSERNGLGEGYSEVLIRELRRRDEYKGGGTKRLSLITVQDFERLMDARKGKRRQSAWPDQTPSTFVTRVSTPHVTAQSKVATYSALRIMLDRGQLVIPREAEGLIRELLLLAVELTPSGHEKIEAASGHDDLPDGLGHALVPFRSDGRWRTLVGDLAARAAPPSGRNLSDDDGAFQSINGSNITSYRARTLARSQ